jgi:hypothetical protein
MSDRTEALAFLNLISQQRQERQLGALKDKADEANRIQSGIEHAAYRQATLQRQQHDKQARAEAIRQRVFDASKDIENLNALLQDPEYAKLVLADHVAYRARSMGMRLRFEGVEVENVAAFADKERVYELYTALAGVYKWAVARLTSQRQKELELAFQYRKEIWRLRQLLELESKWPIVQQVRAALEPLCEERKRTQAELDFVKAKPFFALGFGTSRAKQLGEQSERLRLEISRLQRDGGNFSDDELAQLRQRFGQHGLDELEFMVREHTALIASFSDAVEYEEDRLFDSETPAVQGKAKLPKLAPVKTGGGRGTFEGALYVISKNGGERFENWEQYFCELVAQQPQYEEVLGEADGEVNVLSAEIARGNAFFARTAEEKMVLLSQVTPLPLNRNELYKLVHYFSLKLLGATVWWANQPGLPLRPLDFRQAWC